MVDLGLKGVFGFLKQVKFFAPTWTRTYLRPGMAGRYKKALCDSEENFRNVFHLNALPLTISTVEEGLYLDVNDAFTTLTGYTRQEVVGKTAKEIDVWENWEDRIYLNKIMEAEGRVDNAEVNVRTKSGVCKSSLISAVYMNFEGRRCFLASINDITERKLAEQALLESENRYRSLFRNNQAVMLIIDPDDGGIIEANPAACRFYGYTSSEITRLSITDINVAPPELACFSREKGKPELFRHFFFKHRLSDGQVRDVEVFSSPITIKKRRLLYAIVHDITDRKKAERALHESEERFHKAFMSSPAPMVISDFNTGLFIDANEKTVQMLGYSREELIGRTSFEVGIWADPALRDRVVQKFKHQGHFKDEPMEYITKSGQRLSALWSAESISLSGRKVMLSVFVDETERKKSEKEREGLRKQLLQAQKLETIGRLAGGIAHDYNNMLSVITGYTEMAMDKAKPGTPVHGDLSEILKAANRSTEITRQLLAFARKQTISPRLLDLNETIGNTLKMLRHLIGEDIQLSWKPADHLWRVKIDPAQIDQILANLCVNARDAIVDGGRITIETGNASFDDNCNEGDDVLPGEYVWMSVGDNGSGMDQTTMRNIFEPFFTTKGVGRGTGLGLSTVYGIAKQNKGFVRVESMVAQGSKFTIYLPRHLQEDTTDKASATLAPSATKGETILLVEDEPAILMLAKTMLQKYSYRVIAAGTPKQALEMADRFKGRIDLLITDVIMPEMNGQELSDHLTPLYPEMKTLYMSGYTADVIARRGILEEETCFIQKPFSFIELVNKVRSIL